VVLVVVVRDRLGFCGETGIPEHECCGLCQIQAGLCTVRRQRFDRAPAFSPYQASKRHTARISTEKTYILRKTSFHATRYCITCAENLP